MDPGVSLVASAITAAAIGGVIVGLGDGPELAISSLLKATGYPERRAIVPMSSPCGSRTEACGRWLP